MNLLHLKYAVEIAQTNSMTKAAERLYTSQPNLSRAIRELEETLGVSLFKRTPKGIYPTPEGEEFLGYARKVLTQVDEIESMYQKGDKPARQFSISVPRASYICCAFTEFAKKLDRISSAELTFRETSAQRALSNMLNADYKLGIVRYQSIYDKSFKEMFREKELTFEIIYEFTPILLMSKAHPLAEKKELLIRDLAPYVELGHADPYVPGLSMSTVRKNEAIGAADGKADKHIYLFERGSQMDLLTEVPDTYIWGSPVPKRMLERYSLVQRTCAENDRKYRDVLIYKQDYRLSPIDKAFLDELIKIKRELI